jgi:esterase/lipase
VPAAPESRPARGYAEAIERARAFQALDGPDILPAARTALLVRDAPAPLAVVLLHGYTNSPAQYASLAPMLFAAGLNVFVPRMPEHGDADRMTARIANLTAEALLRSAGEALDIACGLGERIGVLGISMGGVLAAYFAQYRPVDVAVPVAPDFALLQLPYGVSRAFVRLLSWLPNRFVWWDPREKAHHKPATAYPRFSTHALVQTLEISDDVYRASQLQRPLGKRIVTVVNRCDPAINNEATERVVRAWTGWNPNATQYVELRNLPENHDIVDPANPFARTELVYPVLLTALQSEPSPAQKAVS